MSRGQRYYIKCQIRIDRELMVKMATENKEQMTYTNWRIQATRTAAQDRIREPFLRTFRNLRL